MAEIKQRKIDKLKLKLEKSKEKIKETKKEFKNEIRKSINTAIVAAFGFLIALTWKDVITEFVNDITKLSPIQGKFISALIITLISVAGILIVTRLIAVKE